MGGSDEEAAADHLAPARASERPSRTAMAPSIPVLPLLDVHRAVLELRLRGSWRSFHVADPASLAAALANAVAPPRWEQDSSTLTVRVPETGNNEFWTVN